MPFQYYIKDFRHGRAFGILFWNGKKDNETPIRIRNGLKRSTWQYDINGSNAILDNGIEYSAEEMILYNQKREREYFENFPQLRPKYIIPESVFEPEKEPEPVKDNKDAKKKK